MDPQNQMQKPKQLSPFAAYALVGQLGYTIAIPAVLFGFGGAYLDKHLGSSPIFMMLGLGIAFASSALAIRRMLARLFEEQKKWQKERTPQQPQP